MRPRDRLALILVALALAFTALAIGGAPRWAAGVAALLSIATALPYVTSRRTASRPSPLLYPLAAAAALTAAQLVPLPFGLATHLVPGKLALIIDNNAAWGEAPPRWVVASYDPPATLVELAKLVGYLALGWTCVRLTSNRRARRWLAIAVAGVATLVAIVTLVHHAAGLTSVYGLYDLPKPFAPPLLGPLVNVNHLASLLALAVPMTIALAVATPGPARGGWLIAGAVLTATTFLSGSRGGLVGLVAGVVVVAALLIVQRKAGKEESQRRVPLNVALPAGVVAVCSVLLLAMLTAGDLARDLEKTSVDEIYEPHSKFQVWGDATELMPDNHWLGVGRGGFEPAFTRLSPGGVTYSHVENSYLQAAIDWGLPGAALLLLALLAFARAGARRWRHGPLEAGAIAGLVALAVHDLADFSLELPIIVGAAIVLGAILVPERLGAAADPAGGRARAVARGAIVQRAAILAAAAAVVALALSPLGRDARADDARVAAIDEPAARIAAARAAWARHPSDYLLAGRAAQALFTQRDVRAIHTIARALALNPRHGGMHHLAARMLLASQRPAQSAPEFAEAIRWARDVAPIVADVLRAFPDPAAAVKAMPTEPRHLWRLYHALERQPPTALAYVQAAAEANPRDAVTQTLLAQVAISQRRADIAVPAARAAWQQAPQARSATVLGRALALSGDTRGALTLLTDAVGGTAEGPSYDRLQLLFALADVQVEAGDLGGARQTLERASGLASGSRDLMIQCHLKVAAVEDLLGNHNQAEWERGQADQLKEP
ncbi:MAG: O-antigen ligase family protein [Kofleriaceae bacterium]|nr:O-antigen ligase family protein [Kofleriaceae bacterium]